MNKSNVMVVSTQRRFYYYFLYVIIIMRRIIYIFSKVVIRIFHLESLFNKTNTQLITTKSIKDIHEEYFEKEKLRFLATYNMSPDRLLVNMDPIFYDLIGYNKIIENNNSELEQKWKTRILYEATPVGNIAMYYHIYKKGFAYFSDQQSIPYNILNTVAMKYVRIYCCRDLFIDEKIVPENSYSPLVKLWESDINSGNVNKNNKKLQNHSLPNTSKAFVKHKNIVSTNIKPIHKIQIYNINRFIYLGKILNLSFIHNIPKKRGYVIKNTIYNELFDKEHELQKEVLQYKDFRKRLQEKQIKNN